MKKGTVVGLGIGGVVLLLLISFGVFAAGVAQEASRMDDAMKQDLSQHMALEDVKKQLSAQSYEITSSGTAFEANGPAHSFAVYSTHLNLKLDFNSEGKMSGYRLDRA